MITELELKFDITKIQFVSALPETETNTSQLFLNEQNIILRNFAITVMFNCFISYAKESNSGPAPRYLLKIPDILVSLLISDFSELIAEN